jgi:putative nucleotidyltransferase with HDIG domain
MRSRQRTIASFATVMLIVSVAATAWSSRAVHWRDWTVLALLAVLAIGSETLTFDVRGLRLSGSFLAVILAAALLGPAPAVALAVVSTLFESSLRPRPFDRLLYNVATAAAYALLAGLMITVLTPGERNDPLWFGGVVLFTFLVTNAFNFALIAAAARYLFGAPLAALARSFGTALPSEFATGLLTAAVAFTYSYLGAGSIVLAAVVLLIFLYILRTSVQAEERGEELEQRTRELASLQMGLLSTVVQTLNMRDAMTARHSTAVARYSREVAKLLGLDERQQDLIHTAALLHDIGKVVLPDSVLFAERKLTDDEWELIKLHPVHGAKLVERIEGYGPVAEIVLHHHERFSGGGYPAGIAGEEIPLGARILSVADTYDVMTSRDSYRRPVSSEAALAELRRVAGTQLDPRVVEVFERMILENGVAFSHVDEADFEAELAFEKRVADYARPRLTTA